MRTPRMLCAELNSTTIHCTNIKQIHHLAKVLRVKPGQSLQLFDGRGGLAKGTIAEITKISIAITVTNVISQINPYHRAYQAIIPYIKKENLFYLVQKLVEIGINSLVIFKPEHVDQSLAKKDTDKIQGRVEEAVIQACEQSGCNYLPSITYFDSLNVAMDHVLEGSKPENIFVLDTIADKLAGNMNKCDAEMISFVTGPESGFSNKERLLLESSHLSSFTIGHYVLRAETAPLVALSRLHFLHGENS
ncbi:16S rRNA (uracil(1498)-N(3))-methyltransferase [Gammaproteobacteria bacterium]|nr:16S rRNA (uracil(1498)-N(3))-methyltransferase [Gammaproteobacteria bacterium]